MRTCTGFNPCELGHIEGVLGHNESIVPVSFEMPDRPPERDYQITREVIVERNGGLPLQGYIVASAANLQPGEGRSFSLFAEPGTDAVFYVYAINAYEASVWNRFAST